MPTACAWRAGRPQSLHRQSALCGASLSLVSRPVRTVIGARERKAVRAPPIAARQRRSPVIAPDILMRDGQDESSMDIMKYLLKQRIVFVSGFVSDKMCTQVVASLLALEALSEEEEIRLYINSPGGSPYAVVGLVDAIQSIKPPVQTLAMGCCYSYSSLILAAGAPGKRYAMKNTRLMMTQPMGGAQGTWFDIERTVKELNAIYQLYCRYYMKFTSMNQSEIELNTSRDFFFTPEEALDIGLVDHIIRGKNDYFTPPSMIRALKDLGVVDRWSGGLLKVDCD